MENLTQKYEELLKFSITQKLKETSITEKYVELLETNINLKNQFVAQREILCKEYEKKFSLEITNLTDKLKSLTDELIRSNSTSAFYPF